MTALAAIIKPGLYTTIQDMGRPGYRHLGVPQSGAADHLSLALTNNAIGNPYDAPALECTMTGPGLEFLQDTSFAFGGADMRADLNGVAVTPYRLNKASKGDKLILGAAKLGARAYIAIAGGVYGDCFLESRSTYAPAQLAGYQGRALEKGDVITCANMKTSTPRDIPAVLRPRFSHDLVFRALPGPDAVEADSQALNRFFTSQWTVGRRSDRMGAQLQGTQLVFPPSPPMASSPVFPGTVQCPPDGAPFLLLSDAQTVGGYKRIAQLIVADLPLAGQLRPGDHIWFRKTTAEDARDIAAKKSALYAEFLPGGFF